MQNWKEISHPVTLFYRECVAALTISIVKNIRKLLSKLASSQYHVGAVWCVRGAWHGLWWIVARGGFVLLELALWLSTLCT